MDAEMFTDWLEDATDGLAKKNHVRFVSRHSAEGHHLIVAANLE